MSATLTASATNLNACGKPLSQHQHAVSLKPKDNDVHRLYMHVAAGQWWKTEPALCKAMNALQSAVPSEQSQTLTAEALLASAKCMAHLQSQQN